MILSGGVSPEIRQNYSGGHIVLNAIHACLLLKHFHSIDVVFSIVSSVQYMKGCFVISCTGG